MPRLLDAIYKRVGIPQLEVFVSHSMNSIQFAVEAGCHDGADTLVLLKRMGIKKIYAFEPDPVALTKAKSNLKDYLNINVILSESALSNTNRAGGIAFGEVSGNGTSQVIELDGVNTPAIKINMVRLDDVLIEESNSGFLWLDVEGHAVAALEGAPNSLKKINLAKIEVQMHTMGETRPADAFKVISLCRLAGLVPIYLPIHPGFFGDIFFIRPKNTQITLRILGFLKLSLFITLHKFIYPVLGKPKI